MQLLAMITMLIDHIGYVWFPEDAVWRIIGRIALPLYAYSIVIGYSRTRNINKYLTRVGALALISQLPYTLAFQAYEVNAIGTLFLCLLALVLLDRLRGKLVLQLLLLAGLAVLMEVIPFDYGAYALLLVLIYRYADLQLMALMHLLLNIAAWLYSDGGWTLQFFSLFPTLLLVYAPEFLKEMDKVKIPRMLWRSFYPAHLAAIAVIYVTINGHFLQ
ncbi:TraX family protein [Paenibacillus sp. CAU 1782]